MLFSGLTLSILLQLVSGNPPTDDRLQAYLSEDLPFLTDFYRELHQMPELSLLEAQTSARLAGEMASLGFDVRTQFGGHGIVCVLRNGDGPVIMYRTDMDALPVVEKTGLPYASNFQMPDLQGDMTRTMHACGHDMHMTVWLGTARALARMKDQWSGTLVFIGQPAEEIGEGALMMLNAGLFEQFPVPDYGLALHCNPDIATGSVGMASGYTMAAAESVDIRIRGIGAHGAAPQKSIDPVVLASMMVIELQTIVSRNIDPIEPAVVTVGSIHGGTRHNIIPDEVVLQLTVRTFSLETRRLIHRRIQEIARGTAIAAGLPEELFPEVVLPDPTTAAANYNDPALTERLRASAVKVLTDERVVTTQPVTVAEDFAHYGHTVHGIPTVLYWLGTVPAEKLEEAAREEQSLPGLHSPFYAPDPIPSIETGVKVTATMMLDLLREG